MSKPKFYITTPLYYVNDVPHLGHAYTNIAADVLARFKRLQGYEVFFLTGTDEHGQKIEKAAKEQNLSPRELADKVVLKFKDLWKILNISNNDFIRTTEARHIDGVKHVFSRLFDKGDVYKGKYKGWYCVQCETFFLEQDLIDGNCPECKRKVEWVEEESYFFKLSNYQKDLLNYIEKNPDFISPVSRRNEIVNRIKEGLNDLSISRSSFSWGVPIPQDSKHVIYVWIDALINYITGVGYPDMNKVKKWWPANVHIMGKDIIWFHAVIWPALLMSLNIIPPKKVFAHGWWTVEGDKMSKSKGIVVDPVEMVEKFGVDSFRYFVLREVPFGLDGDFSISAMIQRVNSDLANDLGNLVSRTLKMVEKYCNSCVPAKVTDDNEILKNKSIEIVDKISEFMDKLEFHKALVGIWGFINIANKYIEDTAPWKLSKDESSKEKLNAVLYNLVESLRIISLFINPFMPNTSSEILARLGYKDSDISWDNFCKWGQIKPGAKVEKGENLFPRIE